MTARGRCAGTPIYLYEGWASSKTGKNGPIWQQSSPYPLPFNDELPSVV
jgi:hypothetical protein